MFGCGVTVLQSMVSSSNIFAVLRHWIPGSINRHTIAVVEKANCNGKKSRVCVFNDYNNNGGESKTNKKRVRFTKQLESVLHCEFTKRAGTYKGCMDSELVVSTVSACCWETVAISKCMFGSESYRYRYSVWIDTWLMQGL